MDENNKKLLDMLNFVPKKGSEKEDLNEESDDRQVRMSNENLKKEKEALKKEKEILEKEKLIRSLVVLLFFGGILSWFILSVFLSKDNVFLSVLDRDNLYKEHLTLKTKEIKLKKELIKKNKKIGELKSKIENNSFSEKKDEINYIKTEKIVWLHEQDGDDF
jgi:hypothetical protein